MGYSVNCFKDYKINDLGYGDFQFEMIDYAEGLYIYPSVVSKIRKYVDDLGLNFDLVPTFGEQYYFESLTKDQCERIVSWLVKPQDCLDFVSKNELYERLQKDNPDWVITFDNLMKRWQEGYYVIETY